MPNFGPISFYYYHAYSPENLSEKLEFFDSIGLHDLVINNSANLVQSIELTFARYQVLTREGGVLNIADHFGELRIPEDLFKRRYGYTNEEAKKRYPYPRKMRNLIENISKMS